MLRGMKNYLESILIDTTSVGSDMQLLRSDAALGFRILKSCEDPRSSGEPSQLLCSRLFGAALEFWVSLELGTLFLMVGGLGSPF